jgi:hypothetical protein
VKRRHRNQNQSDQRDSPSQEKETMCHMLKEANAVLSSTRQLPLKQSANVIVHWEAPTVNIRQEVKYLGVIRALL